VRCVFKLHNPRGSAVGIIHGQFLQNMVCEPHKVK